MPKLSKYTESKRLLRAAHLAQVGYVGSYGIAHLGVLDVLHAKLQADLTDDFVDGRVVYVGDSGEQVVLHLEVEPAYQPAK